MTSTNGERTPQRIREAELEEIQLKDAEKKKGAWVHSKKGEVREV